MIGSVFLSQIDALLEYPSTRITRFPHIRVARYNLCMAKTLMFTVLSVKGGVGKTVTAVHLAACLSDIGTTLLVDGDATRSATLWAQPGKLPFPVVPERAVSRALAETRYDFIVVDTEANPTDADLKELADSSNFIIVPTTPDGLGLQGARQTVEKLNRAGNRTQFKILLTIVPPRPNRDGQEAISYLKEQNLPQFKPWIPRLVAFQRGVMDGVTVNKLDRVGLGWTSYQRVSEEVLESLELQMSA
jgi:chromosome partitioning protein